MATSVSISSTGLSDWLQLEVQAVHRVEVDLAEGISAATYTLETTASLNGRPKTVKQPDGVTDWTFTDESAAIVIEGQCWVRLNVTALTGVGGITLTRYEVRTT